MITEEIKKNLEHIVCHVSGDDIDLICKYAATAQDGETLVDLGTAYGKSCAAMALVNPNTVVFSVDIEESPLKIEPLDNLFFIRGDSRKVVWHREIAMMNDDCGSHMYQETKDNIEHWFPYMKKGGYVVFHDYLEPEFEVKKAVDEFVKKGWFEFLETKGVSCAVKVL